MAQEPSPSEAIDETLAFRPRWNSDGLMPAVARDEESGAILMVAWMNEAALRLTLETGEAHYWSRSRRAMWCKGETSGNRQRVIDVMIDCDQDTIELIVDQAGPACHTGRQRCFYRRVRLTDQGFQLTPA